MPKSELRSYDDYPYSAAGKEKETSGSLSPFTYLCTVLIIALLGLIVLYSSSYESAVSAGLPHYAYFLNNLIAGFGGLALGFVSRFIPLRILRRGALLFLPLSIAALVMTLFPGLGDSGWLVIGGTRIISAPSLAMFTLPFVFSGMAEPGRSTGGRIALASLSVLLIFIMTLFSGGLSWCLLLSLELAVVMRVRGVRMAAVLMAFILAAALAAAISFIFPEELLSPVTRSMLPMDDPGLYDQALSAAHGAIAAGGITGTGLGNGVYKAGMLPDAEGIMIFASMSEEIGLTGALVLGFLLFLVSILGIRTVSRSVSRGDRASGALVAGFTLFIVLRSAVNIGYVAGVLPLPGVMLPFFSYGPGDELLSVFAASLLYRLIFIMGRENEKR